MVLLLYILLTCLSSIFFKVTSLTEPNDDIDPAAVNSSLLNLEKLVADLQSQNKILEQKQTAVLSSVLSDVTSTTEELRTLQKEHNSTIQELNDLKNQYVRVNRELESLRKENNSTLFQMELMKSSINIINNGTRNMVTEMIHLKRAANSTTDKVFSLQNQMARNYTILQRDLMEMKTDLSSTITDLSIALNQTETEQKSASTELDQIKRIIKSTVIPKQDNLTNALNSMETQIRSDDQKILFKADVLTQRSFPNESNIVYDDVEINLGGAYDSSSGVFRAPVSGIYFFSASVQALATERSTYFIVVNGRGGRRGESKFTAHENLYTASGATVSYVKKGEAVSVYTKTGTKGPLRKSLISQFNGCLIHAEN